MLLQADPQHYTNITLPNVTILGRSTIFTTKQFCERAFWKFFKEKLPFFPP